MSQRKLDAIRRRCYALAREVFGAFRINGVKAYDYYMKKFVVEQLGKSSRTELTEDEWLIVLHWLLELRARMEK